MLTGLWLTSISGGQQLKLKALDQEVRGLELREVSRSLVLERVAKSRKVPIGFEATPQESDKINVMIEQGTVRDVLDQIVQADSRYEWTEADGVINVSPRVNRSPILETVVRRFSVGQVNRVDAISAIFELPEVKVAQMDVKRRDFGSLPVKPYNSVPQFSLTLRNVTVRTILNEIMKAGGDNYWVFFRYGDHNEYFSVNMS
jgi:hypothetical protein